MDYFSLCLICKDENDYLPEWLDYHILMGVERFYIYDNESQVSLRESLKEYIERGWAVVMEIPGQGVQLHAYDHCLRTFGSNTFWLGFIDTDEFLVPKTCLDLKELLREYEGYAGLAVSSLFFGSNGHKIRPEGGQLTGYRMRTHETLKENEWVKSIVQPGLVLMPYSPHDFLYKENSWCVNENFLRVDNQDFPNHTEKIQLNHYFYRSEAEIAMKLGRGRGDAGTAWSRTRFSWINQQATCEDIHILQVLGAFLGAAGYDAQTLLEAPQTYNLLEKLALLARLRQPSVWVNTPTGGVTFREEMITFIKLEKEYQRVKERGNPAEIKQWIEKKLQMYPQRIMSRVDLAICCLNLNDPERAWLELAQAWQAATNSYAVLLGMAYYFLRVSNFQMAEKTCHLLLELAPHNLTVLGFLTEALIGLERWDEAIKIGQPVVGLAGILDAELPDRMGLYLVKKMAQHLLERKEYASAVHLWECGISSRPGDVDTLIELIRTLLQAQDRVGAQKRLSEVRLLDPTNQVVLDLLQQVDGLGSAENAGRH